MKSINKDGKFIDSRRTNRSQQSSSHQRDGNSFLQSRRIYNYSNQSQFDLFNSQSFNINLGKQDKNDVGHYSIEQMIDTFKLYIKSAHELKNYLQLSKSNDISSQQQQQQYRLKQSNFNNTNPSLINRNTTNNKLSQQLTLVMSKLDMFITTAQTQLFKLNKTIQSSSLTQLKSIPSNYHQILTYTKQKYSKLLKQTYRTLNIQTLLSHQQLINQQDLRIVKQNKKKKLQQIKIIQKQLQQLWTQQLKNTDKNKGGRSSNFNNGQQQQNNYSQQKQTINPLLIKFDPSTSTNPRNLQMLKTNNLQQVNLRQLARQQLQRQFLSIRIQAYNMYEKYIQHQHNQNEERLKFVKQEQQILDSQLGQELELSQQISQEFHRLRRELNQIKTINQLIKKRYILRESMKIDSDNSLYQ